MQMPHQSLVLSASGSGGRRCLPILVPDFSTGYLKKHDVFSASRFRVALGPGSCSLANSRLRAYRDRAGFVLSSPTPPESQWTTTDCLCLWKEN